MKCSWLAASFLFLSLAVGGGCDWGKGADEKPVKELPKSIGFVGFLPEEVPAGTLVLRDGEPSGVVGLAEARHLYSLTDPLQPGRSIDRGMRVFWFYLEPDETVHDAKWTLMQRTPCGETSTPIVFAEPMSKEQEEKARDAAKVTADPARELNERRVFLDFKAEDPKRFGKQLQKPTRVYYFPPKGNLRSNRSNAKETVVQIGAAELPWGDGVTISGSGAYSRVIFDVLCKPKAEVVVNGREVGFVPSRKRKKPPGVLVINEFAECLSVQTSEYDDINNMHQQRFSATGKPTYFARETDPVVALSWKGVKHVLKWESEVGVFNELSEAPASNCK